ncbi:aminodeoxychorismate synthase component I [Spirosoma sp. KUDC1026]|uniref:aminodeoxychorismate synthase component I n=1 Tax=Spirosoma sp. KUDC1026 TaxID=2745947 RepID=UPI00159B91B6|nr:aminodeoxychorismate synthase component I [Spirosoma sp. KUDC1026]QKZ15299.1 aminodeoxychorismate synthase component I [Spirosoma sp. KUDC1026]
MEFVRLTIDNVAVWRSRALAWAVAQPTEFVALLNNNHIQYPNDPFPNRLFVGAKRVISCKDASQTAPDIFQQLYDAQQERPSYWIGYVGYDLKNQLEQLTSRNPRRLTFPDAYLIEPAWIIDFLEEEISIQGEGAQDVLHAIKIVDTTSLTPEGQPLEKPLIQCRVSPETYQDNVRRIQEHIVAGDVYELNYCIEFFAEQCRLDPLNTYQALCRRSPMPFSTFLKLGDQYVMGASPERFLKKEGRRILSQPIKGTIRRGHTPDEDISLKSQLLNSEKERAENLMIVDLVRNDLARSAETGSVQVDELFGIYTFQYVHQMISTVSARLRNDVSWVDTLRNAFPMGSMTGAPKIRAMEIIDELEVSRRGVYSGAIGYVTPDNDFDFNVVIRTLLYDARQQYASFSVGSAITYDADPAQEWAECLLKASAIRQVLTGQS